MLPQRYKFSSKSQHNSEETPDYDSCYCYRKDTNFQANHNRTFESIEKMLLLLLPQRYKFSSKSQRCGYLIGFSCCCYCYRKDTNFQANHNAVSSLLCFSMLLLLPQRYKFSSKSQLQYMSEIRYSVVIATAKIQIFKQITTWCPLETMIAGCYCYRKDTNFQANHNPIRDVSSVNMVVIATAKIQIFKQITTLIMQLVLCSCCYCYRKDTNFQANHNPFGSLDISPLVVIATAKIQIFKQIVS